MKVYVSKYALSAGIREMEGLELSEFSDNREQRYVSKSPHFFFSLGKDAHETREAAVSAAEAMRKKKIASLRKQIARLESLTF